MDQIFLEYLARQKHALYHMLHVFKPQAYTSEECYDRITRKVKYETILEVIGMLNPEDSIAFREIYEDLFPKGS